MKDGNVFLLLQVRFRCTDLQSNTFKSLKTNTNESIFSISYTAQMILHFNITIAGAQVIIKVSGFQHRWFAGGLTWK